MRCFLHSAVSQSGGGCCTACRRAADCTGRHRKWAREDSKHRAGSASGLVRLCAGGLVCCSARGGRRVRVAMCSPVPICADPCLCACVCGLAGAGDCPAAACHAHRAAAALPTGIPHSTPHCAHPHPTMSDMISCTRFPTPFDTICLCELISAYLLGIIISGIFGEPGQRDGWPPTAMKSTRIHRSLLAI